MPDEKNTEPSIETTQEFIEQANAMLRDGLKLFSGHVQQISDDLMRFEAQDKEIQEKIKSGGKRTSGSTENVTE